MGKAGNKAMKVNKNHLKKAGPKKGKVLKRPFAKKGATALTRRNLNKLEDMTLEEKVKRAAKEEKKPEAAAESLKKMMSKQEHSKVWSQHQTYLRSQSKQQQKEHEQKSKKEKSQAVARRKAMKLKVCKVPFSKDLLFYLQPPFSAGSNKLANTLWKKGSHKGLKILWKKGLKALWVKRFKILCKKGFSNLKKKGLANRSFEKRVQDPLRKV